MQDRRTHIFNAIEVAKAANDPQQLGCECARCALGPYNHLKLPFHKFLPVFNELRPQTNVLALAQEPGEEEQEEGAPLVGRSGQMLQERCRRQQIARIDISLGNAWLCRSPDNNPEMIAAKVDRWNKAVKAEAAREENEGKRQRILERLLLYPWGACKSQRLITLGLFDNVLVLGAKALNAMLGHALIPREGGHKRARLSITDVRGGPLPGWLVVKRDKETGRIDDRYYLEDLPPNVPQHEAHHLNMLPTFHPAFLLRQRKWVQAFDRDIARAFRWFRGNLQWRDPELLFNPSPEELTEFLASMPHGTVNAWDTETSPPPGYPQKAALEPMIARLDMFGIGNRNKVAAITFRSREGKAYYSLPELRECASILQERLGDWRYPKVGWNSRYYDTMIAMYAKDPQGFPWFPNVRVTHSVDGILLDRLRNPELPHGLAFVGSVRTDAPAWKADHTAVTATVDLDLAKYLSMDVGITDIVSSELVEEVNRIGQGHLIQWEHASTDVCAQMHQVGILVDQKRRQYWEDLITGERDEWKKKCQDIAGDAILGAGETEWDESNRDPELDQVDMEDWNPNSYARVADLVYGRWGYPINHLTDCGNPSTKDTAVIELLATITAQLREPMGAAAKQQLETHRAFLLALRHTRKRVKTKGTYLEKLDPEIERKTKGKKYTLIRVGDGRLHSTWKAFGTSTGRYSSADPNAQNIPTFLRDMFIAGEGHVLVGADKDQLELRTMAVIAGLGQYIATFRDPLLDPHGDVTATVMMGAEYTSLVACEHCGRKVSDGACAHTEGNKPSKKSPASRVRDFAKNICYAGLYKAELSTIHRLILEAEDRKFNLVNLMADPERTAQAYYSWLEGMPELARYWTSIVEQFKMAKFVAEPILGRRLWCQDGFNENQIINFHGGQAPGASMLIQEMVAMTVDPTVVSECQERVAGTGWGDGGAPLRLGFGGEHTGPNAQVHDYAMFEVPEDRAEWARDIVQATMDRDVPELPGVRFAAGAKIGNNWAELG